MSNQSELYFCGNAQIWQSDEGDTVLFIELDFDELVNHIRQAYSEPAKRKWTDRGGKEHRVVRLKAAPMHNPRKNATHYLALNTSQRKQEDQPQPQQSNQSDPFGDLPF